MTPTRRSRTAPVLAQGSGDAARPRQAGRTPFSPDPSCQDPAGPGPAVAGRLTDLLLGFTRALRAAGLPIGPGKLLDAAQALQTIGLARREDVYWALAAVYLTRPDQREIFTQTFDLFWRNPKLLERMMGLLLPSLENPERPAGRPMRRRLADALSENRPAPPPPVKSSTAELDMRLTFSARETLKTQDFEDMSAAELAAAKRLIAALRLPLDQTKTRRWRPGATQGRIDLRQTLRSTAAAGGETLDLHRRTRKITPPPLVILCDISGSMGRYSRMLLHFIHQIMQNQRRVHAFLFGTSLTNITRHLRHRDVDQALADAGKQAQDWAGGTRIAPCLENFNRLWSRRVLGGGAVVLLITDGLDRGGGHGLEAAMARLHRACRRLIWLNPLLRWEGFAPKPAGIRAMLPHVDELRPVHNLESLEQLVAALAAPGDRRAMDKWRDAGP